MRASASTNRTIADMVRAGETNLKIAERVGMTCDAVARRIVKLRAAGIDLPHRVGKGVATAWRAEEDAELAALYITHPDSVLGVRFGRTPTAVARRRAKLGLHRPIAANDSSGIYPGGPRGYSRTELDWARANATTGANCEARMMLAFAADHKRWRKRRAEVTQQ